MDYLTTIAFYVSTEALREDVIKKLREAKKYIIEWGNYYNCEFKKDGGEVSGNKLVEYFDDGEVEHITFLKNNYLKFLVIKSEEGDDEGQTFGDKDETWGLNDLSITISYNNDFMVMNGKINSDFNKMEGQWESQQGYSGKWSGYLIRNEVED